jgi:hypothetical protein
MATPPVFTSGAVLTAAQMNNVGLWLVSSGTITATTAGNFDDVFTSDYANYRITVNATTGASTAPALDFALRAGGSTLAGDWYRTSITSSNTAGPTRAWSVTGTNTCQVGNVSDARGGQIIIDVFQPQASDSTRIISQSQAWGSAASNAGTFWNVGDTDVGTGFRLSCASNFTATVRIYGYR